jgi:hypothetical protein
VNRQPGEDSWRDLVLTLLVVFSIATAGCLVAFGWWLQSLTAPQVVLLGAGNRLSLLISEGPARLVLATGDDPIAYENALSHVRPLFARRIDVLLLAGAGESLLVPLAAVADGHARVVAALASLPPSPERTAIGPVAAFPAARRIQVGPSVSVLVETALPVGADPAETFPAWRATVERGETRIVILSDGGAAALFRPVAPVSVLAVSGSNPAEAWEIAPAVAFVANAEAIGGPELRAAFADSPRSPTWGFRVFPSEALQLRFVAGGIEIGSESAQQLAGTPVAASVPSPPVAVRVRVRRREPLWRERTRP